MRRVVLAVAALLAAAPAPAAEPLGVLGLRSGASRVEVQSAYPEMLFQEEPYLDPWVGDA